MEGQSDERDVPSEPEPILALSSSAKSLDRNQRQIAADKAAAEDLHMKFLEIIGDPKRTWQEIADLFIPHPAFQQKLATTVILALRGDANDAEKHSDLSAQATYFVTLGFRRHRNLMYQEGIGSFDAWLFSVAKRATLYSKRHLDRQNRVTPRNREAFSRHFRYESDRRALGAKNMASLRDLLEEIQSMPQGLTRDVMLDWAAGYNGSDSANHLGVSEATISEHRKKGVDHLVKRLGINPPNLKD